MAAYLIVDSRIHDEAAYDRYKAGARPILERHGGEYLARGGTLDVVEDGTWTPTRLVIVRFPDADAARAALDDPDYAPLRALRQGAATATLAIVEGI
jgi:uncharacterized protein (DUF1330 family)